ncbi:uncharacterized protein RHOBADRAFT_46332 [Rhodotorula graminis WP1]|uniref:Uncharacterized protein n=1 Tax=Rhodotorula graminis (strain WP1) TaxID=578459 RepID=A0A0P9EZU3_RHOGW|nr:uncharacterized protein RHOBADRAFT_46332 [Rhodotorula graminis WP1]KPV72737.1 hypothetical protein RHOBADRAFT_46332 [Rhodotorula graminis WP1]
MAAPQLNAMRGLDSQHVREAVADAYVAAALRTVRTPAARERFTEQAERWLGDMNRRLEPDWWPTWPEARREEFRNEMERVRAVYATAVLRDPLEDGMISPKMLSTVLEHMRMSFNRLGYLVTKISLTPPSHADPEQWRLATRKWFHDGVAKDLTAREFDTAGYVQRMEVVDELDRVRHMLAGTIPDYRTLDHLPSIRDPRSFLAYAHLLIDANVNSALDRLHEDHPDADRRAEEAEILRAYAQSRGIAIPTLPPHSPDGDGVDAHSLAHGSWRRL